MSLLRVKPIEGEPTSFMVESDEVQCVNPECSKLLKKTPKLASHFTARQEATLRFAGVWRKVEGTIRLLTSRPTIASGDPCPKCGAALGERWHRVDLTAGGFNGVCSCEYFAFALGPEVRKLSKADQALGIHRCQHISAARDFALDARLMAEEKWRTKQANGKREACVL